MCIIGPALPYTLALFPMTESADGSGVLLFGGEGLEDTDDRILELRAGSNSWNILDITLQRRRHAHIVIPML